MDRHREQGEKIGGAEVSSYPTDRRHRRWICGTHRKVIAKAQHSHPKGSSREQRNDQQWSNRRVGELEMARRINPYNRTAMAGCVLGES